MASTALATAHPNIFSVLSDSQHNLVRIRGRVDLWVLTVTDAAQAWVVSAVCPRTPDNATEGLESGPPTLIPFMEGGLGTG